MKTQAASQLHNKKPLPNQEVVFFHSTKFLFYFYCPAHVIGDLACLDSVDRIVQFLCDRSDFSVVDDHVFILVAQFADRGDYCSSTGCKHFLELAVLVCLNDFVDRCLSFGNLDALLLQDSDYGVSRDTRQDRSIQRSRYNFVADYEECVGSTNFFNILSVNAVQPEDLLVALCMSFFLSL